MTHMAGDLASGVPFKQSIKRQVPKTLKEAVDEVKFQSGSAGRSIGYVGPWAYNTLLLLY